MITSPLWVALTLIGAAWDISRAVRAQLEKHG